MVAIYYRNGNPINIDNSSAIDTKVVVTHFSKHDIPSNRKNKL